MPTAAVAAIIVIDRLLK